MPPLDVDNIIQRLFESRNGRLPRALRAMQSFEQSAACEQVFEPNYQDMPRDFGDVRDELVAEGMTNEQVLTILILMRQAINIVVTDKTGDTAAPDAVEFRYTKPLGFCFGRYDSGLGKPIPYAFINDIRTRFERRIRQEIHFDPTLSDLGRRRMEHAEKSAPQRALPDGMIITLN